MFDRIKDVGHPDEEMLSVYREYGVIKKSSRDDNTNQTAENRDIYQLIDEGWFVVNRMKAWQGSVGISPLRGIVSGHYICFRPRHHEDPRFLNWLLRSSVYALEYARMSRGVRPGQIEIDNDELRGLRIALPPLDEQRRIADFLDAETARIDQLTAARRSQVARLGELWNSRLAVAISHQARINGWIPLRRIVTSVEQGWSPQCDDAVAEADQWAVLKTSAVSSGEFIATEHKRLPPEIEPDLRYQIRDGDILLTRGSGSPDHVGIPALAKTGGRQLLLSDLLYRIRLGREWSPELVTLALRSKPVRGLTGLLFRGQSGQTIKLRGEDIRSIEIPAVPASRQAKIAAELLAEQSAIRRARQSIELSLSLLAERRQALITAAVTGEITV